MTVKVGADFSFTHYQMPQRPRFFASFDFAQDKPFDGAQDKPFGGAQGKQGKSLRMTEQIQAACCYTHHEPSV
jgi:hypothetical protein